MKTTKTYDWPTRLFHWTFAFFFISSFIIAKYVESESVVYGYHMLSGLMMAMAVLLRVLWGFIGSRHARFNSFHFHLGSLFIYFKNIFSRKSKIYGGHNPASSWSAIIMMVLALAMAITGIMMSLRIRKEVVEEIHSWMSTGFIIIVGAHVGGVLLHAFLHRDGLATSMMDGNKMLPDSHPAIIKTHPKQGLAYIFALLVAALFLLTQYNAQTGQLHLGNKTLQLGEEQE